MKKAKYSIPFSTIALAFSLLASGTAQAEWIKSYGTKGNEYGAVMPSSQGGYYLSMISVATATNSKSAALLSLLNASGVLAWTKKITTGAYDNFFFSELSDGRILLQGSTQSTANGAGNAVWAVYNVNRASGALSPVFRKAYKGKGDDQLGITQDSSGVLWGTGSTTSFSADGTGKDIILAKLDANTGLPVWSKVFHNDYTNNLTAITPKGSRYILLANAQNSTSTSQKIVVGQINNLGVPVSGSFKKYGTSGINTAIGIKAIANGNYLLYGVNNTGLTDENTKIFVVKLDTNLNYVWGKNYSAGADQGLQINEANENADGSLTLLGNLKAKVYLDQGGLHIPLYSTLHPAVIQVSAAGAVNSSKSFEYQEMDSASFAKNPDGSYLLGGQTMAFNLSGGGAGNIDALYGHFSAELAPNWVKSLGGTKIDSAFIRPLALGYSLSGSSNSFGAGNLDLLAGTLDANGDVPGCSFIKEVTLTETTPIITATDLNWQPQATTLVKKGVIKAVDITLNVNNAALTTKNVCSH